jgi:hypothetical protein
MADYQILQSSRPQAHYLGLRREFLSQQVLLSRNARRDNALDPRLVDWNNLPCTAPKLRDPVAGHVKVCMSIDNCAARPKSMPLAPYGSPVFRGKHGCHWPPLHHGLRLLTPGQHAESAVIKDIHDVSIVSVPVGNA